MKTFMKILRTIAKVLVILFAIFYAILVFNFIANKNLNQKYEDKKYEECSYKAWLTLGFTEPYVALYNEGNVCYNQGDYEGAVESYEKALKYKMSDENALKVRINMILAKLKLENLDNIKYDDIDPLIERLESYIEELDKSEDALSDDTETADDGNKLKREIQKLIDDLKNQKDASANQQQQGDGGQQKQNNDDQNNGDDQQEQEKSKQDKQQEIDDGMSEKEKEIRDIQNQSTQDRQNEQDNSDARNHDDYNGFPDEPNW